MKILLADIEPIDFYPLCLTRPIGDLRLGIQTIAEKWQQISGLDVGFICKSPLSSKFPALHDTELTFINARVIPGEEQWEEISSLEANEALFSGNDWIAIRTSEQELDTEALSTSLKNKRISENFRMINNLQDLFLLCGEEIRADFKRITEGRNSAPLHESNILIGPKDELFIEEGAKVHASVLNTSEGPIYIGRDAEVMEGSAIRGPFALSDSAVVKMATKIYGPTSIGPFSKVGGELSNVVIQGYSNKGHDGFLGNSVIGEWCNLGADTNSSNLKNNYGKVSVWSYRSQSLEKTDLTFCGLIMGDHSKCSINTMFNTGTVVGVNANIFGNGFPPKLVPSFSWGGSEGFVDFELDKALNIAEAVCARRGVKFTDNDRLILTNVRNEKPESGR